MSNLVISAVSNQDLVIDLRDLVPVLDSGDIQALRRKFVSYCKLTSSKFATSYESVTYLNSNNVETQSFIMTELMAKAFAMRVDPEKGVDYMMALEVKTAKAVKLLEAENARLLALPPVVVTKTTSSKVNRVSLHKQREELFAQGVCDHWTETVTHHYYPVNSYGLSLGYTDTGKGKKTTIKL